MVFKADGRTLSQVKIESEVFKSTLNFLDVQINAPSRPDLFAPPADMKVKKAEQKEVYKMFEGMAAVAESMGGM
jgi:hypothetical protein